jgi:hypothetical protein
MISVGGGDHLGTVLQWWWVLVMAIVLWILFEIVLTSKISVGDDDGTEVGIITQWR